MKRKIKENILLLLPYIIPMSLLYGLEYYFIRDLRNIAIDTIVATTDFFTQIIISTFFIQVMMAKVNKKSTMKKVNILASSFFTEIGTNLLKVFVNADDTIPTLRQYAQIDDGWSNKQFKTLEKKISAYKHTIDINKINLVEVRDFLKEKEPLLIQFLSGCNLENQMDFTELIISVLHLSDELRSVDDFKGLSEEDLKHLEGDCNRVYKYLAIRWIKYMMHSKIFYEHLFSKELRDSPFR